MDGQAGVSLRSVYMREMQVFSRCDKLITNTADIVLVGGRVMLSLLQLSERWSCHI